jgi:hypothetical protein
MSTAREKTFVCTFTSRTRRLSLRVQAWDARQAALIFREELAERGLGARGDVEVVPAARPSSVRMEPARHAG